MLYPLSYRGNGNYCTTTWDLGRSPVCRLAPYSSWKSQHPIPARHRIMVYNCSTVELTARPLEGAESAMICWRRPWRDSDSPSW